MCELMTALDLPQPKISRHLGQLRKAGLLLDRRQGQWVFYRLHPLLNDWMRNTKDGHPAIDKGFMPGTKKRLISRSDERCREQQVWFDRCVTH